MDATHEHWYFKNPESLQCMALWGKLPWDSILGIYRHPEESIRTIHSNEAINFRKDVWNRYMRVMLNQATHFIRYPDDVNTLAEVFGTESPLKNRRTRIASDPCKVNWCRRWWKALEDKRSSLEELTSLFAPVVSSATIGSQTDTP